MDTLAARLREAFLGTETGEAVPFDELKDAVRDRWQRVADAAREVPPEGIALAAARERGRRAALRVPSVEELATIGHEANTNFVVHEDAATAIRDAVLAGLPTGEHAPIRVPFSDEQIERMARAAQPIVYEGTKWHIIDESAKTALRQGIRAALAAGGLEPCAVPGYDPDDVALAPTGHVLRDRLVEAEAKIERQRKNLRQLYEARERDAQLIADLRAEVDEDNAAAASVNDLLVKVQNLTAERDALRERASVPVPAGDTPDDQVEALARVLCDAYCASNKNYGQEWDGLREIGRSNYMAEARAAIAHLHKRPEGLPTAEELAEIVHEVIMNPSLKSPVSPHIVEAILTALRPWLRDPVGCEMDVTWQEMQEWLEPDSIGRRSSPHEILDLCRSRIRPVFECKECDQWRKDWDTQAKAYEMLSKAYNAASKQLNAARAALEGE